jgi:hypothetical protein
MKPLDFPPNRFHVLLPELRMKPIPIVPKSLDASDQSAVLFADSPGANVSGSCPICATSHHSTILRDVTRQFGAKPFWLIDFTERPPNDVKPLGSLGLLCGHYKQVPIRLFGVNPRCTRSK